MYKHVQIAFEVIFILVLLALSLSLPFCPSFLNILLGCCLLFIQHEYSISVWNAVLVNYCAEPLWQEATLCVKQTFQQADITNANVPELVSRRNALLLRNLFYSNIQPPLLVS